MPRSEIERRVLGAMLLNDEMARCATERLNSRCFNGRGHALIFATFAWYQEAHNEPGDLVLVYELLRQHDLLDRVGGPEYLRKIVEAVPDVCCIENEVKDLLAACQADASVGN